MHEWESLSWKTAGSHSIFPYLLLHTQKLRVFCLTVCSVTQSCPYVMEEAIWFNFIKELGDLQRSRIDYV